MSELQKIEWLGEFYLKIIIADQPTVPAAERQSPGLESQGRGPKTCPTDFEGKRAIRPPFLPEAGSPEKKKLLGKK